MALIAPRASTSLAQIDAGDAVPEQPGGGGLAALHREQRVLDRVALPAARRACAGERGQLARATACGPRARRTRPIRSWPSERQVPVGLARRRSRRRSTRREAEVVDRRVDQHRREATAAQPPVVLVRRRPARRSGRRRRRPRKRAGRAACRRSRPPTGRPAVRVHSTGVKPRWASEPPTTSANAGKIGFCSSGRTRPTSRARSPRSLAGRSYPSTSSAVSTASRVASEMPGLPLRTRLTVASLTPTYLATSASRREGARVMLQRYDILTQLFA